MDYAELHNGVNRVRDVIGTIILGKDAAVELLMVGLLAGGHILIDDVPGTGKTTLAKALARCLACSFQRIQFTPDLMPADVTGYTYFDQKEQAFKFHAGPVMNQVVLADEINRAIPRTQSSLLECMGEGQVTHDGVTRILPKPFFVLATENPVEEEGTFPLPEAQLDRFLMCVKVGYPSLEDEEKMLLTYNGDNPLERVQPLLTPMEVEEYKQLCRQVKLEQSLRSYLLDLCRKTREHKSIILGASPRASLALMYASQALAAIRSRSYVLPDDVKYLAPFVLGHRLVVKPQERLRELKGVSVIEEIIKSTPVPVHGEGVFDG
jgi:MoxR-like ATPase